MRYEDLQDQKRSEREDGKSVFKDDDSEDDEDVVELSKGIFFFKFHGKNQANYVTLPRPLLLIFFSYFI